MKLDHPTEAAIPGLRELWQEAFGDGDAFLDLFFTAAFSPERCLCALDGDAVVGAVYWFGCSCDGRKVAYLYAIATKKSSRGRGICRALIEKTLGHLKETGCSGALLVPGERGLFEMYRKLGFSDGPEIREFSCTPGPAVPIRQIGALEYAALREKLLPAGGVVQEGENLAFLERTARFYAGDGFLLAAGMQNGCLEGLELLGDTAAAPGILTALGASAGRFRTPGKTRRFAMYHPLDASAAPAYFALAFD